MTLHSVCYNQEDRRKIAETIINLRKCIIETDQQKILIHERLQTFDGAESIKWWQEPTTVVGGVVVSFSIGTLIGYLATR